MTDRRHLNAQRATVPAPASAHPRPLPDWWTLEGLGDEPVFVVGGGPNAAGFPWERLRGRRVVLAGHQADVVHHACAVVGVDRRFWGWAAHREYGWDPAELPGEMVWPRAGHSLPHPWLRHVERAASAWSFTLNMLPGQHSGLAALNLARLLTRGTVYLVGFDCRRLGEQQTWHHGGHPGPSQPASVYDRFALSLHKAATWAGDVRHLTTPTALDWWPAATMKEALG